MTSARGWWIAGALAGSLLAGCGGGGDPMPDVPRTEGGTQDVQNMNMDVPGGTDAADVPTTMEGGRDVMMTRSDPCAAGAVVDLTSMMPGADGVVRYTGNNNMAGTTGGLPTPRGCLAAAKGSMVSIGHQVALRYRMRTTAALRVSTANMGTTEAFDTAVMVVDQCAPAAMVLGCNDDAARDTFHSTVTSSGSIPMGTEVFIIVGGYTPPASDMTQAQGDFELTVREIAPIAVGQPCMRGDICVEGATCLPTTTDPSMNTCQQDGTQGALCRMSDPRCDMGLTCSASSPMEPGVCRAQVGPMAACDVTGRTNFCATGTSCGFTSARTGQCVTPTPEVEPNNGPGAMAQPAITAPTTFSAAIDPGTDTDCFRVTVPMNGSLYIRTHNGEGGCPEGADTIVRLFNPAGMMVAENDDAVGLCSEINGTMSGPAHGLAAGDYSVCVVAFGTMMRPAMPIPNYQLSIAILNP